MKKLILILFLGGFCSFFSAQNLGANFNENLSTIDHNLLKDSGVSWVRGFVNINKLFLNAEEGNISAGQFNKILKWPDIDPFLATSKIRTSSGQMRQILSLKLEFKNRNMGVPQVGSKGAIALYNTIYEFLKAHGTGAETDILVLGNEPMWETEKEDAEKYRAFLNELINRVDRWKRQENWNYDIYIGAVNRSSQVQDHPIKEVIIDITKNNPKVIGLDVHIHAASIEEIEDDLKFIREEQGVNKSIISTEFSIVRVFNLHKNELIPTSFASKYGYDQSLKIYEYLNQSMERVTTNKPISSVELLELFESYDWYPKNWFNKFEELFSKYGVAIATYRLMSDGDMNKRLNQKSQLWDINALYLGKILGSTKGKFNTNPLVYPDFKD